MINSNRYGILENVGLRELPKLDGSTAFERMMTEPVRVLQKGGFPKLDKDGQPVVERRRKDLNLQQLRQALRSQAFKDFAALFPVSGDRNPVPTVNGQPSAGSSQDGQQPAALQNR